MDGEEDPGRDTEPEAQPFVGSYLCNPELPMYTCLGRARLPRRPAVPMEARDAIEIRSSGALSCRGSARLFPERSGRQRGCFATLRWGRRFRLQCRLLWE